MLEWKGHAKAVQLDYLVIGYIGHDVFKFQARGAKLYIPRPTGAVKNANLKGNMNESGGFVLKGPMAMLALSALCLVVMMGFYYFYNQFKRSSKSYTVVVNKGG